MAFGGETAESYYDEGLTASMKGDLKRAEACFKKALQLDSGFLAARHQLGKCFLRMGHGKEAIELLNQVVRQRPSQMAPRIDLGYSLLGQGYEDEARQVFNDVINADYTNARAYMGLAHISFRRTQWREAIGYARAALEHGGSHFAAQFLLGRAASNAGDNQAAAEALENADTLMEKSLEVKPNNPEGYFLRGEVAYFRKHYGDALEHYDEALQHAESGRYYSAYGESFTRLDILGKKGLCYQALDRNERAREMGDAIVKEDPDHPIGKALKDL